MKKSLAIILAILLVLLLFPLISEGFGATAKAAGSIEVSLSLYGSGVRSTYVTIQQLLEAYGSGGVNVSSVNAYIGTTSSDLKWCDGWDGVEAYNPVRTWHGYLATIHGLLPNTKYYLNSVFVIDGGTYKTNTITFTTLPAASITKSVVSEISAEDATLTGEVDDPDFDDIVEFGYYFGVSENSLAKIRCKSYQQGATWNTGKDRAVFSEKVSVGYGNLRAGSKYYYQVFCVLKHGDGNTEIKGKLNNFIASGWALVPTAQITRGETFDLTKLITPSSAVSKLRLSWSTAGFTDFNQVSIKGNKLRVIVSELGMRRGSKFSVTASTADGKKSTCVVTLLDWPKAIEYSYNFDDGLLGFMTAGSSYSINVDYSPSDFVDKRLKCLSTNKSIVSITSNENGSIGLKANKTGFANLLVSSMGSANVKKGAVLEVRNGNYARDLDAALCAGKKQFSSLASSFTIYAALYTDNQGKLEGLLKKAGFASPTVRDLSNGGNNQKPKYIVTTKRATNGRLLVYINVRGSKSLQDWMNNLQFGTLPLDQQVTDALTARLKAREVPEPSIVRWLTGTHMGFQEYAAAMILDESKYDIQVSTMQRMNMEDFLFSSDAKNAEFFISGHSMGGAVAAIYAEHLLTHCMIPSKNVHVYTHGAPKEYKTSKRDKLSSKFIDAWNLVNAGDPVPKIGARIGIGNRVGKDRQYYKNSSQKKNLSFFLEPYGLPGAEEHNPVVYKSRFAYTQ